jgi:hypothetical protein
MKDYIKRVYGDKEHYYDNLRIYVKEAWEQITEEQLNSLIDSMRERCLAVIEAEGGLQSSEIKYKPLPPLQTLGALAPPTKYRPDTIVSTGFIQPLV